jgi:hypothetical protein
MKLLDWLQKPAGSGIEAGVSEIIKLAIVGLAGAVFNHLIGLFPGVNSSFWGTKPFTVYAIAVWLALAGARQLVIVGVCRRSNQPYMGFVPADPSASYRNL